VSLLGNLQGIDPVQEAVEDFMVVGHFWISDVRSKETG
jgi:hypothetical protein